MKAIGRWLAERWITIGSPIALLVLWEWASATGILRAVFFPRPSSREHAMLLHHDRWSEEPNVLFDLLQLGVDCLGPDAGRRVGNVQDVRGLGGDR